MVGSRPCHDLQFRRQSKHEPAAAAGCILDPDSPAVRFDSQLAEGQAQPDASPFDSLDLYEFLKDVFALLRRDARAIIGHCDDYMLWRFYRCYLDPAALRGEL